MTGTLDLSAADLTIVTGILREHLPAGTKAWVFGSRATGTARAYSDLDLALEGPRQLDSALLADLRLAMSESDLRYKVDLIDLQRVDPAFRASIGPDLIPLLV